MNFLALGAIILGFVLLLVGLIVWLSQDDMEWYTWLLLIGGAVILVVGIILWFTLGKKGDDEVEVEEVKKMK